MGCVCDVYTHTQTLLVTIVYPSESMPHEIIHNSFSRVKNTLMSTFILLWHYHHLDTNTQIIFSLLSPRSSYSLFSVVVMLWQFSVILLWGHTYAIIMDFHNQWPIMIVRWQ